jgi:hypothetical protein
VTTEHHAVRLRHKSGHGNYLEAQRGQRSPELLEKISIEEERSEGRRSQVHNFEYDGLILTHVHVEFQYTACDTL